MILDIYPSRLKGRPLERHYFDGTLHDWMLLNVPGYKPGEDQPVSASVGGRILSPTEWQTEWPKGQVIEIRPLPREFASVAAIIGKVVVSALISMALTAIFGSKPKSPGQIPAPKDLSFSDVKANTARLNQVRPEIAGRHRVYPDYLCQPYKRFVDKRTQETRLMLSIGNGEFDVPEAEMKIGETLFASFGGVEHEIFAPGASVAGNLAHRNWYNCSNVGPTLGGSGIRLTAGAVSGTVVANLSAATFSGSSLLVPSGGGVLPQDWEVGQKISVIAYTRSMTIVDGGGTFISPVRDKVRGDFSDLGLSVSDIVYIGGDVGGIYRVASVTSTTEAGSASTIVGSVVAALSFATTPVTLYVAGQSVVLDTDFADADELVTGMNAQLGGATVSHDTGVITITDDSPYDGQNISLSGNYAPVLGPTPYFSSGTASTSYVELTFDVEKTYQAKNWDGELSWDGDGNPVMISGWFPAASFAPGEYSNIAIFKSSVFRIESLITGTLPDSSTGTVGLELQRLNSDGSDDASWTGFFPETTTSLVDVAREPGQVVGGWSGWFDISPNDEPVSRIEYDLFFPAGLIRYNKEGKIRAHSATVEIEYSVDGAAPVSTVRTFTDATVDQIGYTYGVDLPAGSKNVRMRCRRVGVEVASSQYSDRVEWYGARSLLPSATSYPGVTTLALKITGSESVSVQTNNQVNLRVTRKLSGVAERGIVPWVKYVLDSIGIPSANIDSDEFERLHDLWVARGDYFDFVQLEQANVREVINRALGAGFAEVTIDDGLVKPVRDEARTVFEESYSAQNMTSPLRRSFKSIRPDDFDGVDVVYLDPDTFVEKTIQYRLPGDAGYKAELIRAEGVNDATRAWRIAARRRREQKYRRWAYEWSTEMDALNSGYLSYCAVVDDVPGYGRSGWIKDAYLDGATCVLQVSEPFEFEAGQSHVVAWRDLEGVLVGPFPVTAGSNGYELVAATTTLPEFDDSAEPPHVYFGTTTRWHHPVLISKVAPEGMTSCKVSAFNYDARVYAEDDNAPD